jgi:hypothetical protein
VDRPYPWLKFVRADEITDPEISFSDCPVMSPMGEKLGSIDGFIVDSTTGRPYYVVVDAGGWFKSKHFLLPIGHGSIDVQGGRHTLVADLSRDRIKRFPGFDKSQFETMTPEAMKTLNDQICIACSVETISYPASESYDAAWTRSDYALPDWWQSEPSLPNRMGERAFYEGVEYPRESSTSAERHVAHDTSDGMESDRSDPSPHFGGRAQPGDVIGFETGGERTYIGDTAEDENKRREDAERKATKR